MGSGGGGRRLVGRESPPDEDYISLYQKITIPYCPLADVSRTVPPPGRNIAAATGGFDLTKNYSLDFLQRGLAAEDHYGLMKELLGSPDLDTIFGNPSDALLILTSVPAFAMFKGVDQMIQNPDKITAESVSSNDFYQVW